MSITKPSGANGDFALPETATWEPGIYQLEANDNVIAGAGEIDNLQAMGLANRTQYLKQALDDLQTALGDMDLSLFAPKHSPALTGVPTAPTAAFDDASGQIATTAWVGNALAHLASAQGFEFHLMSPEIGYIKLPTWLGGFIIQWAHVALTNDNPNTLNFPIVFPTACVQAIAVDSGGGCISYGCSIINNYQYNVFFNNWANPSTARIIALGY
jgi:hypothetical protein